MELYMPSQRRTGKTAQRPNDGNLTPHDAASGDSTAAEGERRRMWRVEVPAPALPAIPTITAVVGGGGLTAAIATGHVQPGVGWPAVTLAIAGMAYDIAIRALNRPRPA
ncbi:hypothetical protein J2S54_000034 [Streptomyces sp. DSM 42143]|uniref:hypothetical protein n=1 Tax=Streptomyces sp. DSM 42143 TaxID=2817711 RepID=UPI0027820F49|nr:hypothetical protein [Streptomyces sp. DSM 42143]MDQ0383214.1 hypothetical protein [Streptomyces sp. DSM 42143]